MTEPNEQQRIDRLAIEFMGWHRLPGDWWGHQGCFAAPTSWNPFESHDDAHDLLEECGRRGLESKYLRKKAAIISLHSGPDDNLSWGLEMATAKQQAEAVESVAGLGEKT